METRINNSQTYNLTSARRLRVKTKKTQPNIFVSPSNLTRKKKTESHGSKLVKASLKKKKKSLTKKLPNTNDFNSYKKLFCSTFSKFDSSNNTNPYKSNFHGFYNQVKIKTEDNAKIQATDEEIKCDMTNFLKNRGDGINAKTLEKTEKIFDSALELLEKDPSFLESFDMTKITNNVNDVKIKLDHCRKVVQKYNLNKEAYNNHSLKDENIEQMVFMKRLKTYDGVKNESKFFFEDFDYDVEFVPKEPQESSKSILGKRKRKEAEVSNILENTKIFTDTVNAHLENNIEVEENITKTVKDSQLDYILKFDKKEEANSFIKNLKMITGNINLDNLDVIENDGKGLGWKIFKNLVVQNLDQGGISARKSLDIVGTKERFRTQKKSSDFFYYEPSTKKTVSHEQEPKKSHKEKNNNSHKKKANDSGKKITPVLPPVINTHHSTEKIVLDEKSDSEAPSSTLIRPIKIEQEDLKSVKTAESLIDDYLEILHHTFRNLSSVDPSFAIQVERKTGRQLQNQNNNPQNYQNYNHNQHHQQQQYQQPHYEELDNNIYQTLSKDFQSEQFRNIQTQNHPDWTNQNKQSLYAVPQTFATNMIPTYPTGISNTIQLTPTISGNYLHMSMLVSSSPQIHPQQIGRKLHENGHTILTPTTTYQQPSHNKVKVNGDLIIPSLRESSPQKSYQVPLMQQSQSMSYMNDHSIENFRTLGESAIQKNSILDPSLNMGRNENKGINNSVGISQNYLTGNLGKSFGLDQISNFEENSNSYFSIFGSMDQVNETIKKSVPFNSDMGEKSIKKNNIILTRTNFSDSSYN